MAARQVRGGRASGSACREASVGVALANVGRHVRDERIPQPWRCVGHPMIRQQQSKRPPATKPKLLCVPVIILPLFPS